MTSSTPIIRGNSLYVKLSKNGGYTWTDAEKRSIELGGNLVAINSEKENIWLNENNLRGWIGFTDAEQEGVWKWTNGDPTTYVTWHPDGSPSNTWGTEHYAQNTSLAWGMLITMETEIWVTLQLQR